MATGNAAQSPELCVICYPFYPTKDSGRGVDRYCFELLANFGDSRVRVLEQGSSVGAWAAGKKLLRLVGSLRSSTSDVYHAVSTPAGATAILSGNAPVVVTIHDLLPFQVQGYNPSFKQAYSRYCTTLCVQRAAALIVPFSVTKDELVSVHHADPSKIHVVNYGLDHATYYPRPAVARSARRILYVGELSRAKGVDVLLRAFAQLKASVPDAQLLLGGKGKDRQWLEDLSRSLELRDVEFRGFVPESELPELYASATVMVFPSRYGFGLSSLEAMACGTPVVVTATLDAPEFIADSGLLVKPEDVADLAAKIGSVLTQPELAAELSRKGLLRAARYSWAATAEKTRAVCDAVAKAHGSGGSSY